MKFARHTIERTTRLVIDDPTRLAEVTARLEAEYCEMAATTESPTPGE